MTPEDDPLSDSRAPFLEHLQELRWRLWRSIVGVFAASCICFIFADGLTDFYLEPVIQALERHEQTPALAQRSLPGAFLFSFKIALIFGLFFGIPVVLYQAWQFIAPGLYKHERRFALPFVVLSSACFIGGALFAYYLVLPVVFDFLIGYGANLGGDTIRLDLTIEDCLSFMTKLLLAFGIVFELPVAVAFLSFVGMVTHRSLIRFWRWALVISFILGAALTPPDLISQLFLAGPLSILYGISIGIAYVITKRRERDGTDGGPDRPTAGESAPSTPPGPVGPVVSESGLEAFDNDERSERQTPAPVSTDNSKPIKPPREDRSTYERSVADRQLSMPFQPADPEPSISSEDAQPTFEDDDE